MSAPLDNPPYTTDVIEGKPGVLSGPWTRWMQLFWARVMNAVQSLVGVSLTNQSAAIASTTLYTVTLSGLYAINWFARITTADGVSSSMALTVTWREGSHTNTKTFTALTGDTTSTYDGSVWPFYADSGTAITYATSYASNTAAKMRYRLAIGVQQS